jgi:hypothetical protein
MEKTMKLRLLAASALTLATLMSTAPAYAQGPMEFKFDQFLTMADKDKDSMVGKKEFLDAMGQMYDKGMAKMKGDAKMVKGDKMTMDGVRALLAEIYKGS